MKTIYLFLLGMFCCLGSQAQMTKIVDAVTGVPIEMVYVTRNIDDQKPEANGVVEIVDLYSDVNGLVDLSRYTTVQLFDFSKKGYEPATVSRQELEKGVVRLFPKEDMDKTIVISANRFAEYKEDVPQQVTVVTKRDIEFNNPLTSADMMQQTGGVFVQRSQLGGGSPVLRGFEASRVQIVVDGVRMNNAIFRAGHLQNILGIDPATVERTEILFGPSSVVYGSDALGGVMHLSTIYPRMRTDTSSPALKGNVWARLGTAARSRSFHADVNYAAKKFGVLASFSLNQFGDLRTGATGRKSEWGDWGRCMNYVDRFNGADSTVANDKPEVQRNSGYQQGDAMVKAVFMQNPRLFHVVNLQGKTSTDVPRYDRLSEYKNDSTLSYGRWDYGPEKRLLGAYTLNYYPVNPRAFNIMRWIAAYQQFEESRITRRFGSDRQTSRMEKVNAYSLNGNFELRKEKHELRYGMEAIFNSVKSTASYLLLSTGETGAADTRYPSGGSTMMWGGLYATHTWELNDHFVLTEGIRFNYVSLNAQFTDTTFFPLPYPEAVQSHLAPNGNLGLIWKPGTTWKVSLLGSTGFRAPNVDDLAKVFESVAGRVIVPNSDLKPEKTYNAELAVEKKFGEVLYLNAVGFVTLFDDAFAVSPTTLNGADSVLYDGSLSQVVQVVNANRGMIKGFTADAGFVLSRNFRLRSGLTFTKGSLTADTSVFPLDHIAPLFGQTSLIFTMKRIQAELWAQYNGAKSIDDYSPSGEDNEQYALPDGTPAWWTLNLRTSFYVHENLTIQFGVDNMLDRFYRTFSSGLSAPGRNVWVTVRTRF